MFGKLSLNIESLMKSFYEPELADLDQLMQTLRNSFKVESIGKFTEGQFSEGQFNYKSDKQLLKYEGRMEYYKQKYVKDGNGKLYYKNGDVYIGQFQLDLK